MVNLPSLADLQQRESSIPVWWSDQFNLIDNIHREKASQLIKIPSLLTCSKITKTFMETQIHIPAEVNKRIRQRCPFVKAKRKIVAFSDPPTNSFSDSIPHSAHTSPSKGTIFLFRDHGNSGLTTVIHFPKHSLSPTSYFDLLVDLVSQTVFNSDPFSPSFAVSQRL